MVVKYKKLSDDAITPTKAHPEDAGMDLYCSRCGFEGINWVCHSDIAFEIPEGHVGLIFPRSSISNTGMLLCNSVGVIDSIYRGEVSAKYMVVNNEHIYREGERFAQMIIIPYPQVELLESDDLSVTKRGEGGYGSSGK